MSKMTQHPVFCSFKNLNWVPTMCPRSCWRTKQSQTQPHGALGGVGDILTNQTNKLVIINWVNNRKEKHTVLWEDVTVCLDHICSFPWNFLSPQPLPNILSRYMAVSWFPLCPLPRTANQGPTKHLYGSPLPIPDLFYWVVFTNLK